MNRLILQFVKMNLLAKIFIFLSDEGEIIRKTQNHV